MEPIKIFSACIFAGCLLFACASNGSNAPRHQDSSSTTANSSVSNSAGFYCKIDGKEFSATGSDDYSNVAFKSAPGVINFILVKMDKNQKGIPAQFQFFVADHGTTTMHHSNSTDNGSFSAKYSPDNDPDAFGFSEVTVAITSSGASGIKGTFSGILDDYHNHKTIQVTDGSFNLPWSKFSPK